MESRVSRPTVGEFGEFIVKPDTESTEVVDEGISFPRQF